MQFTKYSSIENSYREAEVEKILNNVDPNTTFVVTEKIHGTNLSFLVSEDGIQVAKRTSIISDNEKFYNADLMLEKYRDSFTKLFSFLKSQYNSIQSIQVYGEHFGGHYNGESDKGFKKIQQEVQYIPFTDFIVFDIGINQIIDGEEVRKYLNWDQLKIYAQNFSFKHVPELFRGSFEDCLNYDNQYITKVPELYNLEPIENNITEGNVIKTLEDIRIGKNQERVILKNKNDKFKEKGKVKSKNKNTNITEEQRKWVDEITRYFEKNRLNAVFSKGEVQKDWKQFGKIAGLFFKDAFEDFLKDNPEFLTQIDDKKVRKLIQNLAQNEASKFVREILKREV